MANGFFALVMQRLGLISAAGTVESPHKSRVEWETSRVVRRKQARHQRLMRKRAHQ